MHKIKLQDSMNRMKDDNKGEFDQKRKIELYKNQLVALSKNMFTKEHMEIVRVNKTA